MHHQSQGSTRDTQTNKHTYKQTGRHTYKHTYINISPSRYFHKLLYRAEKQLHRGERGKGGDWGRGKGRGGGGNTGSVTLSNT